MPQLQSFLYPSPCWPWGGLLLLSWRERFIIEEYCNDYYRFVLMITLIMITIHVTYHLLLAQWDDHFEMHRVILPSVPWLTAAKQVSPIGRCANTIDYSWTSRSVNNDWLPTIVHYQSWSIDLSTIEYQQSATITIVIINCALLTIDHETHINNHEPIHHHLLIKHSLLESGHSQ